MARAAPAPLEFSASLLDCLEGAWGERAKVECCAKHALSPAEKDACWKLAARTWHPWRHFFSSKEWPDDFLHRDPPYGPERLSTSKSAQLVADLLTVTALSGIVLPLGAHAAGLPWVARGVRRAIAAVAGGGAHHLAMRSGFDKDLLDLEHALHERSGGTLTREKYEQRKHRRKVLTTSGLAAAALIGPELVRGALGVRARQGLA